MGRGVEVSGWFRQVGYGVAAFIHYLDVCVSEYVSDLSYLRGNVCECCPFLVFVVHSITIRHHVSHTIETHSLIQPYTSRPTTP